MVGRRGRPPKRKMEELQEDHDGKSKSAKEARIEAIPLDASEPARLTLMTLGPADWNHHEAAEQWSEDLASSISKAEESREGMLSQGTSWKGIPSPHSSQVVLSCKRMSSGEAFDCETQTFHFSRASASTLVFVPNSNTPETIKVEIDTDQQEEFANHPLICCVESCGACSDTETTSTFYRVPIGGDRPLWAETLDIPCAGDEVMQHVCSKHFIIPTRLCSTPKSKTRKKKTCDMLLAEEAEKIKQGLASGRPKRTPKPNKNYNWAEIVPLIKAEPDDLEEDEIGSTLSKARNSVFRFREDKENSKPTLDMEEELEKEEEEEEEEEEDLENISLPTNPRPPPPKPKGRPHRIRDSCTQTEGDSKPLVPRHPLREVKVQCCIASQPPNPCTSCSYLNWLRLEELLVDCASKVKGDLCASPVQECLRKVVGSVPHPSHATNVLKLLIGEKRDALENTSDIVLMPSPGDEVEIENVIHPDVEEPMTGLREIIPRAWQKKTKGRKTMGKVEVVNKEEEEEYLDDLGIQEATEMDDEEFQPGYLEDEETEEEDEQGLDDEDWTINKPERESRPGAKKKQRKIQQHTKAKKGQMLVASEEQQEPSTPGVPHISARKGKESKRKHHKLNNDSRSAFVDSKAHQCSECDERFDSLLEARVHRQQVHTGAATWHPQHRCSACGQTFSEKRSLYVHGVVQHGAPHRHQCDQCDYEGPRLYHLKRHMKVHTGERNHVCEICHKGLKSLQAYKNHMVLHTNKGRYRCDQCQKAFNQRRIYEDHCRTHRAARCYSCKYCDAAFKTYKNVACHVRAVHLGDKRFICDICGTQHMTGANLRAHLKIHRNAGSLPHAFHCDVCGANFRGLRGLTVHLEVVHGVAKNLEETGQGATTQHPTRRPQRIDYTVVGDRGGSASRGGEDVNTLTYNSMVGGITHREEEQEDEERENMERNEREIIDEADGDEPEKEEEEMEETEAVMITEEQPSEEADGSTVIVESENFVFRVKAEDIEFEL